MAKMRILERPMAGPKYLDLAAQFRQQIAAGELAPGERLPSFAELREQLGVGQSTLERAYALLERESLISREPGRGVFVAPPQRRPRTGVIGLIGVTPEKTEHPYYARLLAGVQTAAHQNDSQVLLLNDALPVRAELLDGLVIYANRPHRVLAQLPADLPRVVVLFPTDEAPCVLADDFGGARAATRHLIELGHRRIAYLVSDANFEIYRERLGGYRAALLEAGIAARPEWLRLLGEIDNSIQPSYLALAKQSREEMRSWLCDGFADLGCTALLAHNDEVAISALQILREMGVKVPDQLSVIGFDDARFGQIHAPSLSSVSVPLDEIGARAARIIFEQLQNEPPRQPARHKPERLETPVIARESTAPPTADSISTPKECP